MKRFLAVAVLVFLFSGGVWGLMPPVAEKSIDLRLQETLLRMVKGSDRYNRSIARKVLLQYRESEILLDKLRKEYKLLKASM